MNTPATQTTKTLGAFLVEKLGGKARGISEDLFILRCQIGIEDSHIADIVEEYYRNHSNRKLTSGFDRERMLGGLREEKKWFGFISISNFSEKGEVHVSVRAV